MKLVSSEAKRAGSSSCGQWPAPGISTRRLPGICFTAERPWATGMIRSPVPQTRRVGMALGQVEAVGRADPLAVQVDDGPQGVEERGSGVAVGEGRVAAGGLGEVRPGLHAEALEEFGDRRPGADGPRGGDQRHHELGARKGAGAQQGVDLGSQAAAGDEDEPLGVLGELVGELQGDPAAERVARRPSRARSRARRAGRDSRWRRRRASSRHAAWRSARARAGPGRRPCSGRPARPSPRARRPIAR